MNTGQNPPSSHGTEKLMADIKNAAIDFAYGNFPELEQHDVILVAQDCSIYQVKYSQQEQGPGEALNALLFDEVWEVIIPLEVFSRRMKVTVRRYNDGSLDITDELHFLS